MLLRALLFLAPRFHKFSTTDKYQTQINTDPLQGVFNPLFEPLRDTRLDGVSLQRADSKIWQCCLSMYGLIVDNMANGILQGMKSNPCPRCEIPAHEKDTGTNYHRATIHTRNKNRNTLGSGWRKRFLMYLKRFRHLMCTWRMSYMQYT